MLPVPFQSILSATTVSAGLILFGMGYAALFALGRIHHSRRALQMSAASYGGLVVSALLLARILNLHAHWLGLIACLLVGYLVAPPFIWMLCEGVHQTAQPLDPIQGSSND